MMPNEQSISRNVLDHNTLYMAGPRLASYKSSKSKFNASHSLRMMILMQMASRVSFTGEDVVKFVQARRLELAFDKSFDTSFPFGSTSNTDVDHEENILRWFAARQKEEYLVSIG